MTDWDKVREDYESGFNNCEIGRRHGISEGLVRRKAKQGAWAKPYVEPKKKRRKLTIRDRKFVKAVMAGRTPSAAMREAGFTPVTARTNSSKKLVQLAPTIQEIMKKKGLTDDYLMDVLLAGTKATKVISAMVIAKNGEGMADANSMTKDFVEIDDFAVRHKYLETGLKLGGHLKDAQPTIPGAPVSLNIAFMRSSQGLRDMVVISAPKEHSGNGTSR